MSERLQKHRLVTKIYPILAVSILHVQMTLTVIAVNVMLDMRVVTSLRMAKAVKVNVYLYFMSNWCCIPRIMSSILIGGKTNRF